MEKEKENLRPIVHAAIKKIRDRGDKLTGNLVVIESQRRRVEVLAIFNEIIDQEKADEEARVANAISPAIGTAILKDCDERIKAATASRDEKNERLTESYHLLGEEIDELEAAKGSLEQQLSSERKTHAEQALSLEREKAELGGKLLSKQGEIDTLRNQLDAAEKKRDEAIKMHSGLRETLVKRNEELKAARADVNTLRQENIDLKGERNQAVADLNESMRDSERLKEKVEELTGSLETLQGKLAEETKLRFVAERDRDVAKALLEKAELSKQTQPKSSSRATTKTTSAKSKPAKETSPTK